MKALISRVIVAVVIGFAATTVVAQDQPAGTQNGIVTVLDLGKVFKEHKRYNAELESIKREAEALRAEQQTIIKNLKAEVETLRSQLSPGTPEYRKLEEDLVHKEAQASLDYQQKANDVMNKEAEVLYRTYTEITGAVAKISTQYNIGLVLRFDSSEIDQRDRAAVINVVRNRMVIFQRNLDITDLVLAEVNAAATAAAPAANGTRRQ